MSFHTPAHKAPSKVNDAMVVLVDSGESTPLEQACALQRLINSGDIWHFEGAAGRSAMDAIKAGVCAVGTGRRKDYWGNTIPARSDLQPGSFGTIEFVREQQGDEWADEIERQ